MRKLFKKNLSYWLSKDQLNIKHLLNIQLTIANVVIVGIQQLQIGNWHGYLPYNLYKDKSCAAATTDLHPPWRCEGREKKWGTLCSRKTARTGLQIVGYTQELILWAQFLYLLVSRKVLKFFMVQIVSHNWQKLHKTSRNSKIIYTILPPYLFGTVSQVSQELFEALSPVLVILPA